MPEERTEYVWVLDPIDGTKSFITGEGRGLWMISIQRDFLLLIVIELLVCETKILTQLGVNVTITPSVVTLSVQVLQSS